MRRFSAWPERAGGAQAPAGARLYAIGDSHGCLDAMRALHDRILRDCEGEPGGAARRLAVVYLGDYVDRGPESKGLVDLLIEQPLAGFESVHLMGNHEALLLDVLEHDADPMPWLINGGGATLKSYGIDPLARRVGPGGLRAALAQRIPPAHRRFFEGLRRSHVEGDYFFVHAGVRPGVALADQNPDDLLWIREPFLGSKADFGAVVVHGHTPESAPVERPNRIGIDTGACYGGSLTALVLEGASRRYLRVEVNVAGAAGVMR